MKTQKDLIKRFKQIANSITVISFNDNGKRYSTYINLNLLQAFNEINRHITCGRRVLLFDIEGCDLVNKWEMNNEPFISYGKAFEYSLDFAIEAQRVNSSKEYIVKSGLQVGDIIIAEGAGLVREGAIVSTSTENNK